MTSSFSLNTKMIFAGERSRHQFGIFLGMYFNACGANGPRLGLGELFNPDCRDCVTGVRR